MTPKTRPVITSKMKTRTPEEAEAHKKELAEREAKWKVEAEERERKSVPDAVEKLRSEALLKTTEADRLERLYQDFPDLVVKTVGRSPVVYYCSVSVNRVATDLDLRHSCGCCPDGTLNVRVFVETVDGRIYGLPLDTAVGERHYMGGDRPRKGWKEKMGAIGISNALIEKVQGHFQKGLDERIASASKSLEDVSVDDLEPL